MKYVGILLTLVTFFGCTSRGGYESVTRFHDDGRAKPVVAFVPVFDRSGSELGWSLSEEFTANLKSYLIKRDNFYVSSADELNAVVVDLSAENNPFAADISWTKDVFEHHEYVVFTEIVEHDIHPKELKGNFLDKITPSSELSMTMRIRIIDLREPHPEVILQELIHQSHIIPKPGSINEPNPERWKKMTYSVSPIGLAHAQLSKEVVQRIEDYILLSKSK